MTRGKVRRFQPPTSVKGCGYHHSIASVYLLMRVLIGDKMFAPPSVRFFNSSIDLTRFVRVKVSTMEVTTIL